MSEIQTVHAEDHDDSLNAAIVEIMDNVRLLTLATISTDGLPHVNTCYFSRSGFDLFILTPPNARHTEYAISSNKVAVNIFDTNHKVGDPISGLQLEGDFSSLERDRAEVAFDSYCTRHPEIKKHLPDYSFVLENLQSRFFQIKINGGQIISEPRFGSENYIKFSVER